MFKPIRTHLKFYFSYWLHLLKARMSHRYDFLLFIFSDCIIQALGIVFFWTIFSRIPDLKGWRYEQVLFIFGMAQLSYGLFGFLFWGMYDFSQILYSGEFDSILIRPIHPFFQMMIRRIGDLGGVFTGVGLVIYAGATGVFPVSLPNVIFMIMFVVCGALLFLFLHGLIAAVSLFFDNTSQVLMGIFSALIPFGGYPLNIYSPFMRLILTYLIPLAYVGFYPAAFFMNGSWWSKYTLRQPVIALLFGLITLMVWKAGLRKYQSVGN